MPIVLPIANGDNKNFSSIAYATSEDALVITADVLVFQASGFVRLNDGTVDIPKLTSGTFCTRVGGCGTCPDGTALPDNPPQLATNAVLAVSSNALVSSGRIVALTVQDYCRDHQKVWVRYERPPMPGLVVGNIVELYGCQGPFGLWQGVLRSGGIDNDGFVVPFAEIPVSFAFSGTGAQTTHTATSGDVPTPIGNVAVSFELDIAIDDLGSTMSITGTGTAATDILSFSDYMGDAGTALAVEPAPEGSCP